MLDPVTAAADRVPVTATTEEVVAVRPSSVASVNFSSDPGDTLWEKSDAYSGPGALPGARPGVTRRVPRNAEVLPVFVFLDFRVDTPAVSARVP